MDIKEKANRYIIENKDKINKQFRLKYHLMGECGWINDPNGLIQYNGDYHAFFQYNPYDSEWGNIHWGHAISKDLIKWRHMPIALGPDSPYDQDGCFSGSAIEKDGKLFLVYTGNVFIGPDKKKDYKQTQCLAISEDGVVFHKYSKNPIIGSDLIPIGSSTSDFRDPRVFKKGDKYFIIIGTNDGHYRGQVLLYESGDMFEWKYKGVLAKGDELMGSNWECPDLFEIGNQDILIVSPENCNIVNGFENSNSSVYMTGKFKPDKSVFDIYDTHLIDCGFDFYAPQTFKDDKQRRIIMGWMHTWNIPTPTQTEKHNWAGAMTFPREIKFVDNKFLFNPVDEIKNYRCNRYYLSDAKINGEKVLESFGDCYELQVVINANDSAEFGLKLRTGFDEETVLSYKRDGRLFIFDREKSGSGPGGIRKTAIELIDNRLYLRILVDTCSVEVFVNNGEKVMTGLIFPSKESTGIKVFSKGICIIETLSKWDIKLDKTVV